MIARFFPGAASNSKIPESCSLDFGELSRIRCVCFAVMRTQLDFFRTNCRPPRSLHHPAPRSSTTDARRRLHARPFAAETHRGYSPRPSVAQGTVSATEAAADCMNWWRASADLGRPSR